jgi:CheY-like chemotaxis protein
MIDKGCGPGYKTNETNAKNLCILLAEDNESNRKVTMKMLERLGYRADAVLDGREAIQALERQQYDLVLMDIVMPKMSGIDATKEIRRRFPASRQPKIIALTAYVVPNSRKICLESGMDDYLGKPVQMNELKSMICSHLRTKKESAAQD